MLARLVLCVALASCAAACGRVGVGLLPDLSHPAGSPGDSGSAGSAGADASRPGYTAGDPATDAGDVTSDAAVPMDASTDAALDAAVGDAGQPGDAATDAAPAGDSGPPLSCAGEPLFGICWYLAAPSSSCNATCSTHGGFAASASSYVGTSSQGGSVEKCTQILTALGQPGTVQKATRDDDGLGCHIWSDATRYWLDDPSPPFNPAASTPSGLNGRIACGCIR